MKNILDTLRRWLREPTATASPVRGVAASARALRDLERQAPTGFLP